VQLVRRSAFVAIAIALVLGLGAAAYLLVPWKDDPADAATGAPKTKPLFGGKFVLIAQPFANATEVATDAPINVDVVNGRIKKLTVKNPEGAEVQGYLDRLGKWWKANSPLQPGTEYTVTARVIPNRGNAHKETWKFSTVTPRGYLGVRVVPGDNETVGVGQPIALKFTGPVVDKAAVEERLNVTTSVPVEGAWRWMSDTEAHWRPRDYWPAHTEVFFDGDLTGVDAGNGLIGNVHRTAHFRIGDSHVSMANAGAHVLTVYENGAVIKTFPMSAGKDEFPTMSGKHIVLGKAAKVVMDSRTNGIPLESSEGYLETVLWDTQISSTGEYVHAAPWSVDDQGSSNVSHGCINLSTENAEWFYNWSQRGDVVEVTGTPRPPNNDIAMVDWKVPYEQWVLGSATYRGPNTERVTRN
jgi:lipoprotein-anchoring transpeptidase ErfK/SrfK